MTSKTEPSRPLSMGERGLCNGVESCQHGIAWNNGCRACAVPPAELPATLTAMDDVQRVCESTGLGGFVNPAKRSGCWGVGKTAIVNAWVEDGAWDDMLHVDVSCELTLDRVALLNDGSPGPLLWHAIQAARSTT